MFLCEHSSCSHARKSHVATAHHEMPEEIRVNKVGVAAAMIQCSCADGTLHIACQHDLIQK